MIFFGCLEQPVKVSLVFIVPATAERSSPARLARKTGKGRKVAQNISFVLHTPSTHWLSCKQIADIWRLKKRNKGRGKAGITILGTPVCPFFPWNLFRDLQIARRTMSSRWFCKAFRKETILGVKIVPLAFFRQPRRGFGSSHACDFLIQRRLRLLNFHLLNLVGSIIVEIKNSLQTKASVGSIRDTSGFLIAEKNQHNYLGWATSIFLIIKLLGTARKPQNPLFTQVKLCIPDPGNLAGGRI